MVDMERLKRVEEERAQHADRLELIGNNLQKLAYVLVREPDRLRIQNDSIMVVAKPGSRTISPESGSFEKSLDAKLIKDTISSYLRFDQEWRELDKQRQESLRNLQR